jgi:asparagine synthase (glutamine-hydrolysing)
VPIDVRLPYLDRRVIEYAMTVPAIPWLQRKHLLREAMRDRLPDAVRVAPKRGQTGLSSHRLARWWASSPEAFVPSAELARFVDLSAMPALTPDIDPDVAHQHLRVRALDRWLRLRERS